MARFRLFFITLGLAALWLSELYLADMMTLKIATGWGALSGISRMSLAVVAVCLCLLLTRRIWARYATGLILLRNLLILLANSFVLGWELPGILALSLLFIMIVTLNLSPVANEFEEPGMGAKSAFGFAVILLVAVQVMGMPQAVAMKNRIVQTILQGG